MISTSDFKNGISIILDKEIYTLIEFQHVKPGKGGAFVRTKLKQVRSGKVLEKTFRAGEKMEQAILDKRMVQFQYSAGDEYVFMDNDTYDQMSIPAAALGDDARWLVDNLEVLTIMHNGVLLGIELPAAIIAEVVEAEPGVKGDTVTGASKQAKLSTGAVVQVPLFVNEGDKIKVDTRTGNYIERAN